MDLPTGGCKKAVCIQESEMPAQRFARGEWIEILGAAPEWLRESVSLPWDKWTGKQTETGRRGNVATIYCNGNDMCCVSGTRGKGSIKP